MHRYNYSQENVTNAKKFILKKGDIEPSFLKKYKGTVKNGKLFLDDHEVIPRDKIETTLRNWVLSGEVPLTRDGLYYYIKSKQKVGIPRKLIDEFLKKQRIIRETDNQQPTTTKKSRNIHKKGQFVTPKIRLRQTITKIVQNLK